MKKTIKFSILICAVLAFNLLAGCSSKPSTKIDFNAKANFKSFTSFQFSPQQRAIFDENPIMYNRIQSAIEQNLLSQGLAKIVFIDNQSADLTISVNFSQYEKANSSSLSIGLGTGIVRRSGGGSISVSTSVPIHSGPMMMTKITLDMSHHGKAVWHGVASYETSDDVTSKELNNAVNLTVNKLLANFPPE